MKLSIELLREKKYIGLKGNYKVIRIQGVNLIV